jgi:predicted unusual protein kinase regulating ubiquinone biosynthesis (AarF/ABC1/UbiB family)
MRLFPGIIEAETNMAMDELFSSFDRIPIASGAIGQVYKATLKENNLPVAVKVKHPVANKDIIVDLAIMSLLSHYVSTNILYLPTLNIILDRKMLWSGIS